MTDRHNETGFIYDGRDLEAMDFAVAYHGWIFSEIQPYLGSRIVEVGSGTGSFSKLLIATAPTRLCLVEPSQMFDALPANVMHWSPAVDISLYNATFPEARTEIAKGGIVDTILYVNVLEHIKDDNGELRDVHHTLDTGGKCVLFVPALKWLYSEHDRKIGHYRRYSMSELTQKVVGAGFRIVIARYFDMVGIAPWFLKYRLLRSTSLNRGAVVAYDSVVVPIMRRIESTVGVPIGKNLIIVGEKE